MIYRRKLAANEYSVPNLKIGMGKLDLQNAVTVVLKDIEKTNNQMTSSPRFSRHIARLENLVNLYKV